MVNYNHMMPTRYSVDISFDKANINKELLKVTHVKEMDRVPHTRPCHVPAGVTRVSGHAAAAGSVWLGPAGTQRMTSSRCLRQLRLLLVQGLP